jgi:D-cysteine desulfhydrase
VVVEEQVWNDRWTLPYIGRYVHIDSILFFYYGKAAGITTGLALAHGALDETSPPGPTVHAIGVCDTPDYFYDYCAGIVDDMGATLPPGMSTESFMRQHMTVHQGKGLGYAASTSEELDFVTDFALETGVVLDPVYSGKGLYHFMKHVLEQDPDKFRGKNILFWHTGMLSPFSA